MFFLVTRLICIAANLIAVAYFIYHLKRGRQPLYFKCVFYGVMAQLLSWIFYLALSTDTDWNHAFTLGIFGEFAVFIFLATANLRFIPKEYEELHKHFSLPGLIGFLVVLAVFVVATFFNSSFEYIACNVLYTASIGFYVYSAVDVIFNRYNNVFRDGVRIFTLLYTLYALSTAVLQLSFAWYNTTFAIIMLIISTALMVAALIPGTLSLKKGLEPWSM